MYPCAPVLKYRQRRVGSPAALGRTAGHEETDHHDYSANRKRPKTRGVHFRARHVRPTDLQWHNKISKSCECQRHDPGKNHDRPVHRAERVVKVGRHFPVRYHAGAENVPQQVSNHRPCLTGIGQLPAHQHHQAKAKEQKNQAAEPILNADHLMVGGENVFSPPPELMMLVAGVVRVWIVMRFERSGSVHFLKKVVVSISREKTDLQSAKNTSTPKTARPLVAPYQLRLHHSATPSGASAALARPPDVIQTSDRNKRSVHAPTVRSPTRASPIETRNGWGLSEG